jgi:hypothetical protein
MRIFYTGSDIEDLAASGVRQLEMGPGVALTHAAKERAEELGIALVAAGSKAVAPAAAAQGGAAKSGAAKSAALPARPRGCQHGPLAAVTGSRREAASGGGGPVVEQLVEAVSALKKRGG